MYIPGLDTQSVSLEVAGVDSEGRTTYLIEESFTSDADIVGTLTLVEGPTDASLTFANDALSITLGADCTFSDGSADCGEVFDGVTLSITEAITSFAVEIGTTNPVPSASTTPSSASSSSSSRSSSGATSTSGTAIKTSVSATSTSTSTSTAKTNSSTTTRLGITSRLGATAVLGIFGVVAALLL
ncbi:hypothetical protein BT96DRAFT_923928 [Gymnopus androsaceus JB14]|uniref:Uncharacterized protein n=1 Tax=Gymnopus androsaceus JB14 TaxID=1447944 RepID=A0A6A4H7D6_9AGAR|nr:hypothetical protein BT96DRAFT_923928 [Gymnopus androsaceus JB14]